MYSYPSAFLITTWSGSGDLPSAQGNFRSGNGLLCGRALSSDFREVVRHRGAGQPQRGTSSVMADRSDAG